MKNEKKLDKLIQDYNENGFVKLGQIVSKEYSKKLTERALNLMSGKKRYKGMFFQLEEKMENMKISILIQMNLLDLQKLQKDKRFRI